MANRSLLLQEEDFQFKARQIDLFPFSNLTIGANQSLGLGVQFRFREVFEDDKSNELRFIHQYNLTQKFKTGKCSRAEQRINPSQTIHRFRHRLAFDLPLQDVQSDVGESYFITSTESLHSAAESSKPEYDLRITAYLGWLLS